MRDTGSIWVAAPPGFASFNGTSTQKVADIPQGVTVFDMAGYSTGFYAGTSLGVYHYDGNNLVFLGQPAVSIRGVRAQAGRNSAPRLRVDLGMGERGLSAHTV